MPEYSEEYKEKIRLDFMQRDRNGKYKPLYSYQLKQKKLKEIALKRRLEAIEEIVDLRYGNCMTLAKIGEKMGVSRQRIDQIIKAAKVLIDEQ